MVKTANKKLPGTRETWKTWSIYQQPSHNAFCFGTDSLSTIGIFDWNRDLATSKKHKPITVFTTIY